MGSLTNVGFLSSDTGEISTSAKIQYVEAVVAGMKQGTSSGVFGVAFPIQYTGSDEVGETFQISDSISAHQQRYETWHRVNFDIALQGTANMLDQIPTIGVAAKIIPYFDPFQPIIDVLNLLKDNIGQFIGSFDVLQFLTENFTSLLFDAAGLIADIVSISVDFFNNVKEALDRGIEILLNFIIGKILPKLGKTQTEITEIYVQIFGQLQNEEFKNAMLESLRSLVNTIINAPDDIALPNFSFDFLNFDLNLPSTVPLFAAGPPPGVANLYTSLIQSFFAGVVDFIASAADWVLKITQGLDELLTYLVQSLMDIFTQSLRSIFPAIESATGLIASLAEFCNKLIQMTIVSILGYLLGPGIITLTAASLIGLV